MTEDAANNGLAPARGTIRPRDGDLGIDRADTDAEGRMAVRVWREKTREGKVSMLAYLDDYRGGAEGFAQDMESCLRSDDYRVRMNALKLESQLREWLSETPTVNLDQSQHVHVEAPDGVDRTKWLAQVSRGLKELGEGNGHDVEPGPGSNGRGD